MKIELQVHSNRKVTVNNDYLGVVGEDKASTFYFSYDENVPVGEKSLIFNNKKGSFIYPMSGDIFDIPLELTMDTFLKVQLLINADDQTFITEIINFTLDKGLNRTGKNSFDNIKESLIESIDKSLLGIIGSGVIE